MTDAKSRQFEMWSAEVMKQAATNIERIDRALGNANREDHGDDRPVDGCRCTWCSDLRSVERDTDRLARATELAERQIGEQPQPEEWWQGLL